MQILLDSFADSSTEDDGHCREVECIHYWTGHSLMKKFDAIAIHERNAKLLDTVFGRDHSLSLF